MSLTEEDIRGEIIRFLEKLSDKKFDKCSIKDIKLDKTPVWWFFEDRFLGNRLPHQFSDHKEIAKAIKDKKNQPYLKKIKNRVNVFLFKKYFLWNEKSKIWISKLNRKEAKLEKNKQTVMFLIHSNAILLDKPGLGFKVDRIGSIVEEVKKDNKLQAYVSVIAPLSHKASRKLLRYENLVYKFIDAKIKKKARDESLRLHEEWIRIREKISYDSELERELWKSFQEPLDFFFSREMTHIAALYYETYKRILNDKNIKLLCIYSPAGVITRCAVAAAKELNVKCLMAPHGIGSPKGSFWVKDIYFAIEGNEIKKDLIELGNKPENIFVTGPVFMDDIVNYIKTNNEYEKSKNKKILVLPATPVDDAQLSFEEWSKYIGNYLDELHRIPDVEIVIKPKSRDGNIQMYGDIIKQRGYGNIVVEKSPSKDFLYGLIRESDVVVTFYSTTVIESIIIGTPVFVIDLIFKNIYDPMIKNESIPHLNPDADISTTIQKVLSDGKILKKVLNNERKIIGEYLYNVDGKAGKRVLEVMHALLE